MVGERKNIRWVYVGIGVCVGMLLNVVGTGVAQQAPSGQMMLPATSLDKIYKKLDSIEDRTKRYGSRASDILEKVDVVLKNQEAITKELETIRIRASR